MKKISLLLIATAFIAYDKASAQDFVLTHDTVAITTTGTTSSTEELGIYNYLKNVSSETYTYDWRLLNPEDRPTGWVLSGFCDNSICYTSGWQAGQTKTSDDLAPDSISLFKLQIKAQEDVAENTTVAFKFEVKTTNQTDTAYFVIVKNPLGMTVIPVDDERVNIYPNPAGDNLNLFVNSNLNGDIAVFYNIMGQEVKSVSVRNTETQNIDIKGLPGGTYIIKISDNQGKVLTNRRFVKG